MSAFGSGRATRHADQMYNLQKQGAMQQQGVMDAAMPMYQQALQYFAQRANPQQQQMSAAGPNRNGGYFAQHAPQQQGGVQGPGGVSNQQMGIWNNPEDNYRMAQAQDDIGRQQMQQQQMLKHNLGQRGLLDSGAYAAGSERLGENALGQYADFRRNLAINQGQEGERRQQNLLGALQPAFGAGQNAQQTYSNLGQQSQQQAQNAQQQLMGLFSSLGQLGGMFMPQPGAPRPSGPMVNNPYGRRF